MLSKTLPRPVILKYSSLRATLTKERERAWEGFWPRPRGASPQPSLLYSSAVDNGPVYVGRLLSSCQSNPLRWLDTSTPFHQPAAAQSCFSERTQSLPLLWEAGAEGWSGGQPDPLTPLTLHTLRLYRLIVCYKQWRVVVWGLQA